MNNPNLAKTVKNVASQAAGNQYAFVRNLPPGTVPKTPQWVKPFVPSPPVPRPLIRPSPLQPLIQPDVLAPETQPMPQLKKQDEFFDPSWDDPGEFDKPREATGEDEQGEPVSYHRRRIRPRRNCCEPHKFPLWAVELPNRVTDAKMKTDVPWNKRNSTTQGWGYQYCIFQTRSEFHCEGGGTSVNADMSYPDRCWLGEAKYTKNPRNSPFVFDEVKDNPGFFLNEQREEIREKVREEFERYGVVTKTPNAPGKACWNIGLYTAIGHPALFPFFKELYGSEDIEGKIEYVPMREVCKAHNSFGNDDPARPPRINPEDDWWNYDPSEYGNIA
ncbi:hypothetical protein [Pseudovibrio sp. POLY-S9]|uniref:hypothetical protein n=1 Tax=Pseudovibrio sp. POLY-S9 TaxID=1576596 RepID=UPI00070C606F|nr:hypothetical protein [Pseudovibrio sp. POLY-S9]